MEKIGILRRIVFCSLMVVLGGSVLSNVWADPVIYSQPLIGNPLIDSNVSQNDTSGGGGILLPRTTTLSS